MVESNWDKYLKYGEKPWETRQKEKERLAKLSEEIDKVIEKEELDKPIPEDKIIKEIPPLPELDSIKFAMERGNDEIAMWLREGRESGFLDETMIGIALMKYDCPMIYEPEYSCLVNKDSWKDLFHHFKNMHYDKEADLRHAKHLFYKYWMVTFTNEKTNAETREIERKRAANPTPDQLEPYLKRVENRLKWRDTAYAMLQECFVYEANIHHNEIGTGPRVKVKKRHAVLYRFQKVYGLTTKQIAKIFNLTVEGTRKNIYNGMMYEHGNSEKNLPKWMQNVLENNS